MHKTIKIYSKKKALNEGLFSCLYVPFGYERTNLIKWLLPSQNTTI
jgi:hypothetical protein